MLQNMENSGSVSIQRWSFLCIKKSPPLTIIKKSIKHIVYKYVKTHTAAMETQIS